MGGVVSFFRRDKIPPNLKIEKVLEEIEEQIVKYEERISTCRTYQRKRQWSLVIYAFLLELIYVPIFYFFLMPQSTAFLDRSLVAAPLVVIPLIFWMLRKFINFYYSRKIENNELALGELRTKQKDQLEELVRITDFQRTWDLLNKYAPHSALRKRPGAAPPNTPARPPATPKVAPTPIKVAPTPKANPPRTPAPPPPTPVQNPPPIATPKVVHPPRTPAPPPPTPVQNPPQTPIRTPAPRMAPAPSASREVVQPVVPRIQMSQITPPSEDRPWYEKLVDYLVGDAPGSMLVAFCGTCNAHYGLISKDEKDNLQFSCKNCRAFNQSAALSEAPQQQAPESEVRQESSIQQGPKEDLPQEDQPQIQEAVDEADNPPPEQEENDGKSEVQ